MRIGLFRTLWIAALVSNLGEWMQTVGAQWLLIHGPHAAILVSLVQTADALAAPASALGSININPARAVGPAIGGLLVARIGVAAVFGLNTAAFVIYAVVLAFHRQLGATPTRTARIRACLSSRSASRAGKSTTNRPLPSHRRPRLTSSPA